MLAGRRWRPAARPTAATVSLTLSDDAELAALNEAHMGRSGPTDVLSFPLLPPSRLPGAPRPGPGSARGCRRPSRCRRVKPRTWATSSSRSSVPSPRPSVGAGGQTSDVTLGAGRRAAPAHHPRRAAPVRLGSCRARGRAGHARAGTTAAGHRSAGSALGLQQRSSGHEEPVRRRSTTLRAGLLARHRLAQGSPSVLVPAVECGLMTTSGR